MKNGKTKIFAVSALIALNMLCVSAGAEKYDYYTLPDRIINGSQFSEETDAVVTAQPSGAGSIAVSWKDDTESEDKPCYALYIDDVFYKKVRKTECEITGLKKEDSITVSVYKCVNTDGKYIRQKEPLGTVQASPVLLGGIGDITVTQKKSTSYLSWDAVENADIYVIYRYIPLNGTYEKYKTVRTPKFKFSEGLPNESVSFRIVPVKKNGKHPVYGTAGDIGFCANTTADCVSYQYIVKEETLGYDGTDIYSYHFEYPNISLPEGADSTAVNRRIESFCTDNDDYRDFISMTEDEQRSYVDGLKDLSDGIYIGSDYMSVRADVVSSDSNYFTLRFMVSTYTAGAAHGSYYVRYMTFETKTGKYCSFSSRFSLGAFAQNYTDAVIEKLDEARSYDLFEDDNAIVKGYLRDAKFLTDHCYFKDGIMHITFSPYEAASYGDGIIDLEIEVDESVITK